MHAIYVYTVPQYALFQEFACLQERIPNWQGRVLGAIKFRRIEFLPEQTGAPQCRDL